MFEKRMYFCPACGWRFRDHLEDAQDLRCPGCEAEYRVLLDEASGRAIFLRHQDKPIPEPLNLPSGSIRAMVALGLAGTCWFLVAIGRPLPESLLALLLTVLGYYFGFRKYARAAQSSMMDASQKVAAPLHLPGGVIRIVLMLGFVLSAIVLLGRGQFVQGPVLVFYMTLAGLFVGHIVGRIIARDRASGLVLAFNHLKGVIVLLTTLALAVVYLAGWEQQVPPGVVGLLVAVVGFYFGSR